ncbi:MAG: RNA 2',3'-cyclic phosphodiesterase [Candidatus Celerinatantimonas neptuna]|nr:MAG: RNA 2',3'-cyclic phosphodiesterase [Candidatus Celerinatantimonas neptuna]
MNASVPKSEQPRSVRLFFALPIPESVTQVLTDVRQQWLRQLGTSQAIRPIIAENFHLTLRYLGTLSETEKHKWIEIAQQIKQPAFTLKLSSPGYFLRAKTGWIGVHTSTALCDLAQYMSASSNWRPHISLLRGLCEPQTLPDIDNIHCEWPVDRFCLYSSDGHGAPYQKLKTFWF